MADLQAKFSVEHAITPVKQLGTRLKHEGLWALGGLIGVTLVLWYIVLRMLSEPSNLLHRRQNGPSIATSSQQLTTLEAHARHTETAGEL